jgi:p-hydroxybenzoate 3-monooxygenase
VRRLAADVCVMGAGPAGLVVAQRLLQAKVSCILLERMSSEALCVRAKAGMLEHRSVLALERHGLAQPIRERGGTNGVVEICVGGERHVFDYGALTGGRGHCVFSQHLLVRAWADALAEKGAALLFSTEVVALERRGDDPATDPRAGATVRARREAGDEVEIDCRAVVLATGAGSALIPEGIVSHEHTYPFRWLTTMLEMPPLGERTIYAPHERGFAAHLRRSAELTRYYLQIPAADRLENWSDERVRAELEIRLGVARPELAPGSVIRGNVVERDVLDLRVRVREPMQRGCVYLAGDAAHLITPAGGKGMNLAIQDALELSDGLIELFTAGAGQRLSRYSEARLPVIWRTQEFSNWMLTLQCGGVLGFHRAVPDPAASFSHRLHRAQIERLFADPGFARWFAHRYAGADES